VRYLPLYDRLIVEEADDNKRTAGGLFIPDAYTNRKHVAFGRVVAAGCGRTNTEGKTVPLQVKVGDVIAYPRNAPAKVPVFDADGNEHEQMLLREADVIAVVEDMPVVTSLVGLSGAPLSISPASRGLPDSVYENREAIDIAEREGWIDVGEHVDQ